MAQTIKLKRSATPGAVPSTSSLALGEVAINTNDGKMYIKKDDGTESIVEIGSSALSDSFKLYEYAVSSSQTTFSGSDDNSNTLAYNTGSPPYVQVFLNGVLLDWSTDYTATNGTSVVLSTAAASGDLIQIAAYSSTVVSSTSLSFDDNNKLLLGTSSDLELFHDGSNSIINDAGTGNLKFQVGGSDIYSVTTDGIVLANGLDVEASEFIGDIRGAVLFKAQAGEALSKGDVVYISGISGNTTVVSKADADDAAKMPAFGVVADTASSGNPVDIYTNGILSGINTGSFSIGDELYVSTTAGVLTNSPPTGESAKLQKIAKVTRSDTSAGSIFITGAGRTNAVPNLDDGDIFIGNSSNQAVTATLDTSIVPENGNLYYTDARVDSHLNQSTASNGEYLKWNGSDYEWATTPAESDTLADVTSRGNTTTDRVNVGRDRNDAFAISLDTKGPITWNGSLDTSVGLGVTGATTYTDRFTIKHSNGTLGDDIQIQLLPSQTNSNNGNVYIGGGLKLADEINVGVTAFIDDDGANPYPRLILRDTSSGVASAVTHTSLGPLAVGSADTKLKAHTGRLHLQADDATTVILDKTGSGSLATFYNTDTTPADGDIIGELAFHQYAGGTPNDDVSARIIAQHNGTSGDGKLAFHAGPTGATLEILRMTNTGGTFASRKLVMPVTASANSGYLFNAEGQSTGLVLANGGVGGDTIAIDNNNTRVFSHNVVQQTAKFGTKVEIEDTTQSTSTTTGSLVVDGGVGIAKNLNVGNSLEVATIMSDRSFFSTPNSLVIKVLQNAADDASIDGSDIGIYAGASNLIGGIGGASGGDIRLVTGAATGTGGSNGSIFFATGGVATSSSQSNGTNVGSFSGSGNFNLFSLGTNTSPGSDDLKLSGYGLMGNRSSPVYITNAGTGGVQINADGVHGTANRVALFDQGGITFDDPLSATGEVYTNSNQGAWAFRATTGSTSNSSGLWFTGTTARLLLRDSSGNIKTMLAANGTNAENVINNNTIWHAGNDGSGSGLDADTLDGQQGSYYLNQTSAFNNQGQAHSTRTSFASGSPSFAFGFNFVQGNTNGPGVNAANQYYSLYTGLGSQYPATGSGSYGMELAIPRNVSSPYIAIRYNEANSLGSWQKISAGYADSAGSVAWSNVTGKPTIPTNNNQLTNGAGYITGITSSNVTTALGYTPANYDHFRYTGNGYYTSTTTSALVTEAFGDGSLKSGLTAHKTGWSYAGNGNLTDAGRLTELAGTSWLWWTDNTSDSATGNYTALCIAPNTGGSAGKVFIYNNQGSGYSPGWREVWTSTSDGSGSGLDADTLDGVQGANYLRNNAGNNVSTYSNVTRWYSNTNMVTSSGSQSSLECFSSGAGGDAFMTFHVGGDFACYLGLDGGSNRLAFGGWSFGAANYLVAGMGLTNSGNFSASGNITAYSSDERLKENIKPIENALEKLHNISGVTFDWTDECETLGFVPAHKKNDAGVIAQRVQEVLPQAVAPAPFDIEQSTEDGSPYSKSGKDYLTVQYEKIVPLLIEAIKELKSENTALEDRIAALENN